jgi:hypothetical protein
MDLQCEIAANYNTRPCATERKASGARTMASNGKYNARSHRNNELSMRGRVSSRQQKTRRRVMAIGGRTNPRLGFQPSRHWRAKASKMEKALQLSPPEWPGARRAYLIIASSR